MLEGFDAEAAAPRHRVTFLVIAVGLCAVFVLTYFRANLPMRPMPAFIPVYITAVIVTELITAYLLFVHTPLTRRFDILCLAGAYLFSGAMAGGQLMVFPGVLAANGLFGAGPQSFVWTWVLWHGGFPAMVIAAMAELAAKERHQPRAPEDRPWFRRRWLRTVPGRDLRNSRHPVPGEPARTCA